MPEKDRPSFDDIIASPEGKTMADCAQRMRAVSKTLEDVAWTLSIRELGRTVADFARHLSEDAQRIETLALLVPTFEALPKEEKDKVQTKLESHSDPDLQ